MKDQMQYIVIEGRKPQDGAKPTQALLILPKWISPTLACAGIVGRVIELTDGNVIEQGALPIGEQETLESLREDMRSDTESQQEPTADFATSRAEAMEPAPVVSDLTDEAIDALAESMPGGFMGFMKDWGYRQFAREVQARYTGPYSDQAANARIAGLERQLKAFEGGATRQAYDETLAKLQAAEDNLDAWRDAAGAAGLGQECDEKTGQIKRLFMAPTSVQVNDNLNTLCAAYGCLPGQDRLAWVHTKLNALIEAESNVFEANRANDDLEIQLQDLRAVLNQIRKSAKRALQ